MKKLYLGCDEDYKKGHVNIDKNKNIKADIYLDLEGSLPFGDNSVDEIIANHVIEHIHNFIPLMDELNRVCKEGATIKFKTPFYSSWGQFNDPTHIRFFTPFSFNTYFDYWKKKKVKLNFGRGKSSKLNWLFNPVINLNHRVYCRFFAFIFPATEIEFEFEVLNKNTKNLKR
jgi:SAM-dependent methyltransferase